MDDHLQKQKQIFLQDHLFVVTANETRMLHSTLGVYTCFFVYILLYHLSLKYLCCKDPLKPYHPKRSPSTDGNWESSLRKLRKVESGFWKYQRNLAVNWVLRKKCWWKMGTLLLVSFLFWTWLTCGIWPLPKNVVWTNVFLVAWGPPFHSCSSKVGRSYG